jgi:hypothetical protein
MIQTPIDWKQMTWWVCFAVFINLLFNTFVVLSLALPDVLKSLGAIAMKFSS